MKVCIITEGGSKIGFGHLARCKALYEAFKKRGILPEFIIKADDTVADMLANVKYKVIDWLRGKQRISGYIKGASIVIIDSYLADIKFYEKISGLAKKAVYLDDIKRLEYPKGIVINGAIYAEEIDYPERDGVEYLLGIQYFPIRREFRKTPAKKIRRTIGSVMVVFGGNDVRNMTPRVLKLLAARYPHVKKNVVIGKAFGNIAEIKKEADKNTRLAYYPDAASMKSVMSDSDIAVSAGGQTLYELAALGIPTIALTVIDNQVNNMCGWKAAGFIEDIGWWNDKDTLVNLPAALEKFSSPRERIRRSNIGRDLIDGKGAYRIVKALLN